MPDYCVEEVSDHALALILALARGITRLDRSVRAGVWRVTEARPLFRLRGRVLGIVGFGRIACALATKALPLGLRVLAYDPFVDEQSMAALGVERRELRALLEEAHIVSLHLPLKSTTRHLLGDAEFSAMRADAYLVNTSRGGLVDTKALYRALQARTIAGAALDVIEEEPPAPDELLLTLDNVVLTPHAAFYSEESLADLRQAAAKQLVVALEGGRPVHLVNPEALARRGGTPASAGWKGGSSTDDR